MRDASRRRADCGHKCHAQRKTYCKDLHRWGRNLLYIVGECSRNQSGSTVGVLSCILDLFTNACASVPNFICNPGHMRVAR